MSPATIDTEASEFRRNFNTVSDCLGGTTVDPFPLYARMRRTTPVMQGDILAQFGVPSQADFMHTGRPVYTLFKYEDVLSVLKDPVTYTSGLLNEGFGLFLDGFLLTGMDVEQHKLARNLLAPAFSAAAVAKWQQRVERIFHEEIIGPLKSRKRGDLFAEIMLPAPLRLIYAIIGFPNDRAEVEQFATWGMQILLGVTDAEGAAQRAQAASRAIFEHCMPYIARRRAAGSGGEDLIGYLLRANYDGRRLTDEEITSLIRQLLPAASETTTRSFGSIVVALLAHRAVIDRIRADRSLVIKAINEGLRWCTPSQFLARQCTRDVEIRGVPIAKGSALSLASGSANRDEEIFPNAEEFDIDRLQRPNAAFGFGAHLCLGMQVAKMEMSVMLNALLDACPNVRLDPAVPPPQILGVQLRGPRQIQVVWD